MMNKVADNIPSGFGVCPVCGIKFTLNHKDVKTFYWSNNNKETTSDHVASKICSNIKRTDIDPNLCVNKDGKHVKGLGWGESLEEKAIASWYEDFQKMNNQDI